MSTTKKISSESSDEKRRAVNQKFVFVGLGIVAVLSVAVYFLHKLQVDRNADVFRVRAEAAQKNLESGKAIENYTRYLGFRPDDTDARAELGMLIQDNAKSGNDLLRAFLTFEKVLLEDEGRDEIRNRLIDVAIRLQRFSEAESHIQRLLPAAANSAELEYKLGVCAELQDKLDMAAELYQKAIDHGYVKPTVFLQLARLLNRESEGSTRADELIDRMIEANPESVEAILVRAGLRLGKGEHEEARKDLARAEELDPGNIETALLESRIPVPVDLPTDEKDGTVETVRSKLDRAIEIKPTDALSYQRISELELAAGNQDAAVQALRSGIAAAEKPAELLAVLGDLLISQGKLSEAEEQLEQLKKLQGTGLFVDFLNARVHVAKGELPEALKLFRKVQPLVTELPQLRELSSLYVAFCFEAMGDPDGQIKELRNALANSPQSEQTMFRLASALQANGKADEALDIYRRISHLPGVPLELARLEFQKTIRQPSEQRDWPRLEAMVQLAGEKQKPVQVALLRQQIMLAQGKPAEAVELLKKLQAEAPSEEVTDRLVLLLMSQGDVGQAGEVIDEAQKKLGDTVALRIARAHLIIETREENSDERLGKLETGSEAFSKDDQFRLFSALADHYELRGSAESADRLRNLAAQLRPYDLRTRIRLFETAMARDQRKVAAEHLQKLRDIAGTDNPQVLAAEVLLLVTSDDLSRANLDKAYSLLSDVAAKRPGWYRISLMLGVLSEREGNLDLAGQKYREAIEQGDREPRDIARAMTLYSRLDKYDEMERMLEQLRIDSPPSVRPLLRRLQAEVALNRGDLGEALKLVGEAVPRDTPDPQEQIWVGAMLEKLRQPGDAELAYRAAVRLDPHQANSWIALISFLNRQKKPFESEIAEARELFKAQSDSGDFARLLEAAGQFDEPEQYYIKRLAKDPQSAGAILDVASFYQRTARVQKAEPYLRSLLEPDRKYRQPVVMQARRSLAGILATRDYQSFLEALALLDANLAAGGDRTTDLVAKASLLAVRPNPAQLREAMLLLQELDGKQSLNSKSRVLLAQLCDALDERETASQHWQKLLGPNAQSMYLAMYVRRQLQNKDLEDVPPLLTQLQKLEPNIAAELSFRWQVQSGNAEAGIKSLTQYLAQGDEIPEVQSRRIYQVSELVEQVASGLKQDSPERQQLFAASEAWYREILEKVPEATLALARLLGSAGRISEALTLCDGARTAQSSYQVCSIAMQIVRQPGATAADVMQVETWLKEATEAETDVKSQIAQVQLGEFGLLHERYQQSFDIYERLLQQSPDNVIVLNNLAWLVSMWKGDHDRAEKLVGQAISKVGPVAALLDTRGTIRLNSGDYEKAIADFRDAVAMDDKPSNRFHLALACWKDKKPEATRLNFRAAMDAGFRPEDLLSLENKAFGPALTEMQAAMDANL